MSERESVAIVGIGCRFPGGVCDVASFWRLLSEERSAITEIPADRFDLTHFYDPRPATPGHVMSRWGGFLDKIERFDAGFFGISPREAERLDPAQRLVLETAWEGLEDAGIDVNTLDGSRTGVYVGQWLSDFEARLFSEPEAIDFHMTTGSGRYCTSGRLSYLLGLQGPSLTLDTACSSSLVAIHLAVRSLRSGESTLALAGGVNVILQPHISVAYSQSRMMAPDGRCKFGDASGDGYVRSEGAGLVVLKTLAQAQADGDRIYAVIRGSAVNNDGRGSGSMGTPSRSGQEALLRAAYNDAGVAPGRVGYVEAHGTGTRAGDPVELGALGAVLGGGRSAGQRARVGSVKTNFGHTEGAAGVAGLIKLALALHHGRIPRSLHCRELNPAVDWERSPCEIALEAQTWQGMERFGGVSAFGIAGTNAHVVLEGAPGEATQDVGAGDLARESPALWPLSARSPEALAVIAGRLADLIESPQPPSFAAVGAALARRRSALEHRAAFVADDAQALAGALRAFAGGEAPAPTAGQVAPGSRPKLAFVVPGQGAQWANMARELLANNAAFREAILACDTALRPWADWSIVEQLTFAPDSAEYRLERIDVLQPVLVALAIGYAAWLRSVGIEPDAVVGHSMGEVAAAHLAGVLSLGQCMRIIARRSALMHRTSGRGAMALVDLSMVDAQARITGREAQLSVAVSNSPRSSVISGDPLAVREVMNSLEREGVFCRLIKVDVASHSPQMQPLAEELARELADLVPSPARVPIVSTVTGARADGESFDAAYWARNLRQPVRFADATRALFEQGVSVFVELSPHALLSVALQQNAQAAGHEVQTVACGRRDEPDLAAATAALATLWVAGVAPDWSRLAPNRAWQVPLPNYPWQRERHWVRAAQIRPFGDRSETPSVTRPEDAVLSWLHRIEWQAAPLDPVPVQAVAGRWLVLVPADADAGTLTAAFAAAGMAYELIALEEVDGALARVHASDDGEVRGLVVFAPQDARAAFTPVRVLQSFLRRAWRSQPRMWWVTRGAQAVRPGEPADVDQAALWGTARVLAEEHPDLWGGLVDLDVGDLTADDANSLIAHLSNTGGEEQVALRASRRFAARLVAIDIDDGTGRFTWRTDAAYLVTGGLGGVGLQVAKALAAQGARRLVLLGRTPLPARNTWASVDPASPAGERIAGVRALEAAGVSVHLATVDLGDASQLQSFLEAYAAEGWPPIRGVVHAAAALDNHLVRDMDAAAFDAVMASKLRAAQWLDRLLPELDLFVLFSSIVAVIGQSGEANYAAANAGLEALAQSRRARGQPALSISWGVWSGTGFAKGEAGERVTAELGRQGIAAFAPDIGAALFSWLCQGTAGSVAVLPVDWAAFHRARLGRGLPLYRGLMSQGAAAASDTADALPQRLAAAEPAERRSLLESLVRDSVGKVLKIAPARIDPRKTFGSMGLGSLLAMELRNRLEAALGRSLSATLAWNHPTVSALVEFLMAGFGAAPAEPRRADTAISEAASALAPGLHEIAELSDEDVLLALRGQGGGRR